MSNDIQTRSSGAPDSTDSRQKASRYGSAALTPPVDVIEDAAGITLYADLPGVSRENLNLHVEAETLTIEAQSSLSVPDGLKTSHTEVGLGRSSASSRSARSWTPRRFPPSSRRAC